MIQPDRKERPIIAKRNGLNIRTQLKANKKINTVSKSQKIKNNQLQEQRKQVLIRANNHCEICGKIPDWRGLEVHHVVFRSHGGKNDQTNLQALCGICHSKIHGIEEI